MKCISMLRPPAAPLLHETAAIEVLEAQFLAGCADLNQTKKGFAKI